MEVVMPIGVNRVKERLLELYPELYVTKDELGWVQILCTKPITIRCTHCGSEFRKGDPGQVIVGNHIESEDMAWYDAATNLGHRDLL